MTYTLIRLVDSTTNWAPVFALRNDVGRIKTKTEAASRPTQHWQRPQDVFRDMAQEDPYARIVWEGSLY